MISFQKLGAHGRLGNQLFQYAFLRTTAERLGVKFYCPKWIGDDIFLLNDDDERAKEPVGINKTYAEPSNIGFIESALWIEDGTDILGYFQTEKYFDKEKMKKWYTFRKEKIAAVIDKNKHIDFLNSVGLHLRFGDNLLAYNYPFYYICPRDYYTKALLKIPKKENILVFSDEIEIAKKYLSGLHGKITYFEGHKDYEDLYLMTRCHNFICSISTLSWWGAWLNTYQDSIVIVPKEGSHRPGTPVKNNDFWPEKWIKITALKSWWNNYHIVKLHPRFLMFRFRNWLRS